MQIEAAERMGGGSWVLFGTGLNGRLFIALARGSSFRVVSVSARPDSLGELVGSGGFFLRRWDDRTVMAASSRFPYQIATIDTTALLRWLPSIAPRFLEQFARTEAGWNLWHGLSAVALADGSILQTFADLGSSRRALILRGSDGVVLRAKALDGPMAFVAASRSGKMLLGFGRFPEARSMCFHVG
jgi:hypothetical protein